eukprot:gene4813-9600_t
MAAVSSIENPRTPHEQRIAATQFVDQFKQRADCLEYMNFVIMGDAPEHTIVVKFFCLKVLEDWIFLWWNKVDANEQGRMRAGILNLLQNVDHFKESRAIRTKIAKLVSEVGKRQFPQHWPSFIEDLVSFWNTGPESKSEYLVEDCIDTDFNTSLPTQRRQDIIQGITQYMEPLLSFSYTYLFKCVEVVVSYSQISTSTVIQSALLAKTVLQFLKVLLYLAKPIDFYNESYNIIEACVSMLSNITLFPTDSSGNALSTELNTSLIELQQSVGDLLEGLVDHKLPWESFKFFLSQLPKAVTHTCNQLQPPVYHCGRGNVSLEAVLKLYCTLTNTMFTMINNGNIHISHKSFSQDISNEQELCVYVQTLASLSTHLFREQSLRHIPWMKEAAMHIMKCTYVNMLISWLVG